LEEKHSTGKKEQFLKYHQEDKPVSGKRDMSKEQERRPTRYQKEQTVEENSLFPTAVLKRRGKKSVGNMEAIQKENNGSGPTDHDKKIRHQKRAVKHREMKGTTQFIQNHHVHMPRPLLQC